MALHDLTPQLRTRLSRMERAVGWFVLIALAALLFGFSYYLYNTAERKGWFKTKAPYFTFTETATGLRVGDPVHLMGFPVGRITRIDAQPPYDPYNVYLEFEVQSPYYGYLWTKGSYAKVATADLLGNRVLELTKGTNGYPTYIFNPLREVSIAEIDSLPDRERWAYAEEVLHPTTMEFVAAPMQLLTNVSEVRALGITNLSVMDLGKTNKGMTGLWDDKSGRYEPYVSGKTRYWLLADESPAVTERLEQLVNQVQLALPGILNLTNQLSSVLSNTASLTANLSEVANAAKPAVTNIAAVTAQLPPLDRPGALGEWLIPTNINARLDATLGNATTTLDTANTNLAVMAAELTKSLENLSSMSSNLNSQVEANTNMLSTISKTIQDADTFIQGLKRHWLLRSAFKESKPAAPKSARPVRPLVTPKDRK